MSGEDSAISDGGGIDVSDWNLDLIQIAPPRGFSGQIDVGLTVKGESASTEKSFSISVDDRSLSAGGGEAIDGVLLSAGEGSAQDSWLDIVASMNEATDAFDGDATVFDEQIELVKSLESEFEQLNSYETAQL